MPPVWESMQVKAILYRTLLFALMKSHSPSSDLMTYAPNWHEKVGKYTKFSFHQFLKDRAFQKEWVIWIKRLYPRNKKLWSPKSGTHYAQSILLRNALLAGPKCAHSWVYPSRHSFYTVFQQNETAWKRKKDQYDRQVSDAKQQQHKQDSVSATVSVFTKCTIHYC